MTKRWWQFSAEIAHWRWLTSKSIRLTDNRSAFKNPLPDLRSTTHIRWIEQDENKAINRDTQARIWSGWGRPRSRQIWSAASMDLEAHSSTVVLSAATLGSKTSCNDLETKMLLISSQLPTILQYVITMNPLGVAKILEQQPRKIKTCTNTKLSRIPQVQKDVVDPNPLHLQLRALQVHGGF